MNKERMAMVQEEEVKMESGANGTALSDRELQKATIYRVFDSWLTSKRKLAVRS